ncbi:T9SS type A sorting domain-containing protein [Winogradskyella sp. Asnod2-B02-A]|uniref:T9SS type A sorting domain-containing protein n=1 Tax=Winogradskyella sp. Asnod2-B02-A TaxID=3160583 RepID=UPI003869C685
MKQKLLLFFIGICIAFFATDRLNAQCTVISPDYLEDFTSIPPECWDSADNGDATTGPTDFGSGLWGTDGFLNNGNSGAYRINLWQGVKSDWILSPEFDLSGGPFQVDFDFGIMQYASSTEAGTLGSDDQVQLLITADSGATWDILLTYDSNSVVPVTGEHPIVDLSAYSGQTVQIGFLGSEGTVDDTNDTDVFVDNFRVRSVVTCFEPIEISTTQGIGSAQVSWTETGTATSWNIEYGLAGFTLGTGTLISYVSSNPYILTGLVLDTNYDVYVQSICGPEDESSWSLPHQFSFGYCESNPTSNDGEGVTNVTIGTTDFPSLGDLTYENHTTNVVNVFQGINNTVTIDFGHSFTYGTNIWIDFNDNLEFETNELVFQGESEGVNNPHTLDASFVMPTTATLGEHRMRIGTADLLQQIPDPCFNGDWAVTLDFTVNIEQLNCTAPEADYAVVIDCDTDAFFIDVSVTSLGDASSLEISNTLNDETILVTTTDTYQAGPFPFLSSVKAIVINVQDNNCTIQSEYYEILGCPPPNDECEFATVATVNEALTCDALTSGTILAATVSSMPNSNCNVTPSADVWYSFTSTSEIHSISIINIEGGTFDIDHALYEGSCDTLTELYCATTTSSSTPNLIIGNTYFLRVFTSADQPETSTFDLCIRETQTNFICENATPFCSDGNGFVTSNVTDVPSVGTVACLGSTPNPLWNILEIDDSGDIQIEINQIGNSGVGLDVDFALFGPFETLAGACSEIIFVDCPTCPNNTNDPNFYPYGNIVDCSFSTSSVENFTIINAQADEIYLLLTTNYSGIEGTVSLNQTNFGEENSGSLKADFEIDLGPDQNLCDVDSYVLDASTQYGDTYEWYFDGFIIPNEENPTLTVTESGNYGVIVFNDLCASEYYEEITVTFSDCDDVGIINVTAFYDGNANTVLDANELYFSNGYFTYEANNDGVINTVDSSTGTFTIASYDETDTFDINYYFYNEYTDCYDASTISFQDVSVMLGENATVEFPIVNEQSCEDIAVYVINQQAPRPGFTHTNFLVIKNLGVVESSGTVSYTLDEDLILYSTSTGSNYTVTPNATGFSLDFVNLLPEQTISVVISLQTPASLEIGEIVTNTAIYTTSTNDLVSENNESSITEEVIGSYDPNDKMESHGKDILFDDFAVSDEYLYYTIRFQNVGTAEAINVRIEDILDEQLDASTFQMLRSSHDYIVTRTANNLEWNFDNINLPAEQDDADGSNGFVYFKIKPNAGYAIGDVIENSASIYFDFNAPIITNTFQTEFVETLSVTSFESVNFTIYPNPAKDEVTIQLANSNFETGKVNIYNIQGKAILKQITLEENTSVIDISSLESGLYFVELTIGNTSTVQKLIVN